MMPSKGAESGHKEGTKFRPILSDLRGRRDRPRGSLAVTMSRPERLIPPSLEEAVAELKREYPELEDEDIRQALAFAAASLDDKILPPIVAR